MSTNAVIALTPEALNVLFPEGSQARVELQRAALAMAAKQFVKHALGDEAKAFLRQVVQEENNTTQRLLKDELAKHYGDAVYGMGRGRFHLNQDMLDRIKEAVADAVKKEGRAAVDVAVAEQAARLGEIAGSAARTAVYNILKTDIVKVTQEELQYRLSNLGDGLRNVNGA